MNLHNPTCSCKNCETISAKEKELHVQISENSRRDFLKKAGSLGLALGVGGGLIPVSASALHTGDATLKSKEFFSNRAVKQDKAKVITLLQTADIHAQLLTHDEFFIENGKPVYKKRGGYAVLKSMIQHLRAQNPANTMLIDGGDCFQGGGVAALSEGRAIVPLMNNIGYDLMLPGNWEVVYGKEM
jgi:sulfur-oxidizing protein SoxB